MAHKSTFLLPSEPVHVPANPRDNLWQATAAIHATGVPLMARVLPPGTAPRAWEHYPAKDVVNGRMAARWFYHCHNPGERSAVEHGHFHLFVGRRAFPRSLRPLIAPPDRRRPRPSAVHIAALAIDNEGLPLRWFATNRWVTDEWLYPAEAIVSWLAAISFAGEAGDPLVNDWLGAMLRASHNGVAAMLHRRDAALASRDTTGEARSLEILASAPIDLDAMFGA